jgi:hypothetical protein
VTTVQTITTTTLETARAIGELCVDADRACARGDLATLASIALQLAVYTPDPLHCELAALVDLCQARQSARATDTWTSLRDRLYRTA